MLIIACCIISCFISFWPAVLPFKDIKNYIDLFLNIIKTLIPLIKELAPIMPLCWILAGATLMTVELPLFCIIPPPINLIAFPLAEVITGIAGVVLPLLLIVLTAITQGLSP